MTDESRDALDRAAHAEIRLTRIQVERELYPYESDTESERAARMERDCAMYAFTSAHAGGDSFQHRDDVLRRALALSVAENERIISG